MDLGIIRKMSDSRPGGLKKLATDIGMSEANLHRCINNNRIQAGDLEQIARLLNLRIDCFFDDDVKTVELSKIQVAETRDEVLLVQIISSQQKTIERLTATIERLAEGKGAGEGIAHTA